MPTFRKTAILAVFVLTIFYLFHSSHSTPSTPTMAAAPSPKPDVDGVTISTSTSRPVAALQTATRAYPPPQQASRHSAQQPMSDSAPKTLREQLQYQFPYDPEGKFPAYIWQTWKFTPGSGDFAEEFRPAEASWTEKHPGFVHEVVTDEAAVLLMRYLYASTPEVVEVYNALPLPVLKADFFRYLILLARGGIYSDIDTTALKSTTDWIPDGVPRSSFGLVVGIEADPNRTDWRDWYSRRIQFCQWTIQAKPGHPVLRDVVATITEDTLRMRRLGILHQMDKNVMDFTGPGLWTDAIFSYLNNPLYFKMDGRNITWENFTGMESAKKIGDVVVLPITSFSPGVRQMGAKEPDDPMAFVKHDFEGSWKAPSERIHRESVEEQH